MINAKDVTCCFTGHRKIPPEIRNELSRRLRDTLIQLIENGCLYFGVGGALGFDTLAAQTILDLKRQYPNIKLILVLPCLSQADRWKEEDQQIYAYIKGHADKVVYTSREYTRDCMYKRNRHLVDHSGICVCYFTKPSGGTAYTVGYAEQSGLKIINLAESFFEISSQ